MKVSHSYHLFWWMNCRFVYVINHIGTKPRTICWLNLVSDFYEFVFEVILLRSCAEVMNASRNKWRTKFFASIHRCVAKVLASIEAPTLIITLFFFFSLILELLSLAQEMKWLDWKCQLVAKTFRTLVALYRIS